MKSQCLESAVGTSWLDLRNGRKGWCPMYKEWREQQNRDSSPLRLEQTHFGGERETTLKKERKMWPKRQRREMEKCPVVRDGNSHGNSSARQILYPLSHQGNLGAWENQPSEAKYGEALHSQQKQDWELTVA
ncbi:hypothetical protein CapIbe_007239 [Capra ibex]